MATPFALQVNIQGAGTERLMNGLKGITGQAEKLKGQLAQASQGAQSLGRSMMANGMAMAAAGGGIVKQYLSLNEAQVNLENTFNRKVEGAWVDRVLKLTDQLGQDLPGSVEDVIQLATAMRAAGGNAKDMAQGGLEAAASLQVLTKIPHDEMGRMFQEMSNSLGLAGKDAAFLADQLARLGTESGMKVGGVHEALKHLGGPLKAMGMQGKADVDLLFAWMGSMKKAGLDDSMVGSGVKVLMSKLAVVQQKIAGGDTKGVAMAKAGMDLSKHGVDLTFFDQEGKSLGLANLIFQLDKLKALPQETQLLAEAAFFGTRGMLPALLTSVAAVNGQLEAMQGHASLPEMMKKRMESAAGMFEIAKGTGQGVLKHAGQALDKDLKGLLSTLNKWLAKLDAWVIKNPEVTAGILKVVLGLGTLATVGGGALWAVGGLVGTLSRAVPLLGALGKGALVAGPWMVAIGLAGYLIYRNWDKVGPIMESAADALASTVQNIGDLLGQQAGFLGFADAATQKVDGLAKVSWQLAKAIEVISTGLETLSGLMKLLGGPGGSMVFGKFVQDPVKAGWANLKDFQKGWDAGAGLNVWDRFMRADAAGRGSAVARNDAMISGWLQPFEGIAARDSFGIAKKAWGAYPTPPPGMQTTIQITVPPGTPMGIAETIASAVDERVRQRAKEYARILQGGAAIADRGAFAAQGAR